MDEIDEIEGLVQHCEQVGSVCGHCDQNTADTLETLQVLGNFVHVYGVVFDAELDLGVPVIFQVF